MIKHNSTAASVSSRRALLINGLTLASLADFSVVAAAARRKDATKEMETH